MNRMLAVASNSKSLAERYKSIQFLAFDVDGVMTRGDITMDGLDNEWKSFHVRDGIIIKSLPDLGISTGIITGRTSSVVNRRARDLGIQHVLQGSKCKEEGLNLLVKTTNLPRESFCYMGDDIPDVNAIRQSGLGAAPADGCPEARLAADFVSRSNGGMTALRELAEWILKVQGKWKTFLQMHR